MEIDSKKPEIEYKHVSTKRKSFISCELNLNLNLLDLILSINVSVDSSIANTVNTVPTMCQY